MKKRKLSLIFIVIFIISMSSCNDTKRIKSLEHKVQRLEKMNEKLMKDLKEVAIRAQEAAEIALKRLEECKVGKQASF